MRISQAKYNNYLISLTLFYFTVCSITPKILGYSLGAFVITIDKFVLIFLLIAYALSIVYFRTTRINLINRFKDNQLLIGLIITVSILRFISIHFSTDPSYSLKRYLFHILGTIIPFFIVLSFNPKSLNIYRVTRTFLFITISMNLILALEIFLDFNIFSKLIPEQSLSEFQEYSIQDKYRGNSRRIQGPFSNPITLGQFSIIIIPCLIYFKKFNISILKINLGILLLSTLTLFTRSRTFFVLLTALICFALFDFYKKMDKKSKAILLVVTLLFTVILLNIDAGLIKVSSLFDGRSLIEDDNRIIQVALAIPLILNNWLTGYGYGMAAETLNFGTRGGSLGTVDNFFLTIILESGIITVSLFIVFIIIIFKLFLKAENNERYITLGLCLYSIHLITLSVTETHPIFYMVLSIYLSRDILFINRNN